MPVDNFVKAEAELQQFVATSAAQASLMNGTWLPVDEQQTGLQHQQVLMQSGYPAGPDSTGLIAHHQPDPAAAAAQHPAELLGHPADMLAHATGIPQMQAVHPGVPLMDANPDMIVEAAGGELMGHLQAEHMHQDVLMPQACITTHTGNASNGQLLQHQQQEPAWPIQPAQSQSATSSAGADSNARGTQVQSGLRSSGANTGSNANRKG